MELIFSKGGCVGLDYWRFRHTK